MQRDSNPSNLGRRASGIARSGIREIFNLAQDIPDYINFGLGEPDFDTPAAIVAAAVEAAQSGKTHYTVNAGLPDLRRRVSEHLHGLHGLLYDPSDSVIITAGGMGGLYLSMQSLLDEGDEVLVPEPSWPNYVAQVRLAGATPVMVALSPDDGFTLTVDKLQRALTERTRVILLNTPANPTGAVLSAEQLSNLGEFAADNGLFVISDEVYDQFVWSDTGHASIAREPAARDRTVIVNSLSKSYAMTGWRVGFSAGPPELISLMVKLQENIYACPSSVSQYAAMAALEHGAQIVSDMKAAYRERRAVALDRIRAIPGLSALEPEGAFYMFLDIRATGLDSREFAMRLLREKGLALIPGTAFGQSGDGFVRISYATGISQIQAGFDRLEAFIRERID